MSEVWTQERANRVKELKNLDLDELATPDELKELAELREIRDTIRHFEKIKARNDKWQTGRTERRDKVTASRLNTKSNNCSRCGGTGYTGHNVEGGRCFKCN